jgi:hypothetical protein
LKFQIKFIILQTEPLFETSKFKRMSKKIRSIFQTGLCLLLAATQINAASLDTEPKIVASNSEKKETLLLPCPRQSNTQITVPFIDCSGNPSYSYASVTCNAVAEDCNVAEFYALQCSYVGALALANSQIPICPPEN